MTTRLLPRSEHERIAGSDLASALPLFPGTQVIVCEHAQDIVGHLALVPMWHVEGAYVAPSHRGRGVLEHLVDAMHGEAHQMGVSTLFPAAADAGMATFIQRIGGVEMPARWFALAVRGT